MSTNSRPADRTQKADNGWCINCFRPFMAADLRYWYGARSMQVGPLCEACDRIIKVHTRFKASA